MSETIEKSYNRLVAVHEAMEQAMAELCDIDTLGKILDRRSELLSQVDEKIMRKTDKRGEK